MSGNASTRAKNRYNKKNYDAITVRFPIGLRSFIKEVAYKADTSVANYILEAIAEKYKRENGRDFKEAAIEFIEKETDS